MESSGVIKEERYKEICKLVLESFAQEEGNIQYEALGALTAIVQEFQAHPLQLFESMLRTDKRTRCVFLNSCFKNLFVLPLFATPYTGLLSNLCIRDFNTNTT